VHFHPANQPIATGSNHRAPQFVQPRPSGSITAESEDPLQAQGAGAVLLACHKPHRPKPDGEGLSRILEHGARRHGRLTVAARTLEQGGTNGPRLATSATWTPKPLRPPQLKEVLATTFFRREPGLELLQISRVREARSICQGPFPESAQRKGYSYSSVGCSNLMQSIMNL